MSNQEEFQREAKAIRNKNQAEMDLKLYLCHWSGYQKVQARHKKEIQNLAKKHGIDVNFKAWKLNGHWM